MSDGWLLKAVEDAALQRALKTLLSEDSWRFRGLSAKQLIMVIDHYKNSTGLDPQKL